MNQKYFFFLLNYKQIIAKSQVETNKQSFSFVQLFIIRYIKSSILYHEYKVNFTIQKLQLH